MPKIILILFLVLGLGYFVTYHVIESLQWQWYAYFVTNDLKAFLLAVALMWVTRKTKDYFFATCAAVICSYDLMIQVADANQKGNWLEIIYLILLVLLTIWVCLKLRLT